MSWQILISIFLIAATGFALVYRRLAKERPDISRLSNALIYSVVLTPLSLIYAFTTDVINFNFPPFTWVILVIAGMLFALANMFAFKAVTHIDAAQFALIQNMRAVFVILLAAVLFGERLEPTQQIGALLLITTAGSIMVQRFDRSLLKISKYSWIGLLSTALVAVALICEKYLLGEMNIATYIVLGWTLQTISMVILAGSEWSKVKSLSKANWQSIFQLGIFRTTQGLTFISALKITDASLVISAVSYVSVLVFLGSVIFLKEREHLLRKAFGSVLATIGLLLIF